MGKDKIVQAQQAQIPEKLRAVIGRFVNDKLVVLNKEFCEREEIVAILDDMTKELKDALIEAGFDDIEPSVILSFDIALAKKAEIGSKKPERKEYLN